MAARYDAFVLFAEMRTGSNQLEDSLNALPGVQSFGEVFNPVFIGEQGGTGMFGIDIAARAADPMPLLRAVREAEGLSGFRFFHDHDPRILDAVLDDPRIAKVVLTRNPLDSYVSLGIAQETGQWRLTDARMARRTKAVFDPQAFDDLVARQRTFRERLHRRLQVTGQGAFWIAYEEIGELSVLNGLAAWLGVAGRLVAVPGRLKRQNPGTVEEKIANPEVMRAHLATLDPFLLADHLQNEPTRGPAVPTMMAAARSALLALPVPGGPNAALRDWLTALDGAPPVDGMTQKALRPWMRTRPGFTSLAIVRHPVARAHHVFEQMRTATGPQADTIRQVLADQHGADPHGDPKAAFLGFLRFLAVNLGGRSVLPVAPRWASQSAILAGMAQVVLPHRILREDTAQPELDAIAASVDRPPALFTTGGSVPDGLVDDEVEAACLQAYRRDYLAFGFPKWTAR
ncbi:nodulation protein NodH [uncultured Jannaschia sp.]|uniref:nodulation protein NodH n=1 Tax=uncultured Jannaschia sp. TaxID=293347 RepID=UPI00262A99BE|nr:nodulation protein NodH [uncultured Jannaschia sp.]